MRKDQPPRVAFVEPEEALEVHPIAEVLAKIRVDDDFGLTRSGIVFRVNGGEERTLILKDFKPTGGQAAGEPPNVTQATLEEMLRLEQFPLEQTDSITYYAFAEDNYPAGKPSDRDGVAVHRHPAVSADLQSRRHVKRLRTRPVDHSGRVDRPPAVHFESLHPSFEDCQRCPAAQCGHGEPMGRVREDHGRSHPGTGRRAGGQDRPAFPHAPRRPEGMLAAATDLAGRKFEPCAGHDREALTNLVKARNTVRMVLAKPKPGSAQEMRNFDRTQAQKLRRPKEKDEKQEAEQLPERLRQLAKQEEFVYATAAKPPEESDQPSKSKAKSSRDSASGRPAGKPEREAGSSESSSRRSSRRRRPSSRR